MKIQIVSILTISFLSHTVFSQQPKVDSVLTIANNPSNDSIQGKALISLAIEATQKNSKKALNYYRKAIRIAENKLPEAWTGNAYARYALLLSNLGESDSVMMYFDKAKIIKDRFPKYKPSVIAYYNSFGLFYKNKGQYDEALKIYSEFAQLGENFMGQENMAGNFMNIGNLNTSMGKYSLSQTYLYKALAIFEKTKNEMGMSYCYNGLGNQFYKQKNYLKAESFLLKSLALKEKSGNKKAIATGLNGLSMVYMDLKKYSKALEYINKSVKIFEELGLKDQLCETIINKGIIYQRQGDQREALVYFTQGKSLAEEIQNESFLASVNIELGRLHQQQSDYDLALTSLIQSAEQAKVTQNRETELSAHKQLAALYTEQKRYKEALEQHELSQALHDTIEGVSIKSKLYELEAKYESANKEAEIALLKKDQELNSVTQQRQRATQLVMAIAFISILSIVLLLVNRYRVLNKTKREVEMERMRNTIARDLHDDIGSALSSIHIMSKLATEMKENSSQNYLQRIGEQSLKTMDSMSDIVWSINPDNDSPDAMISKMKEFAAEILDSKNIPYSFQGEDVLKGIPLTIELRKNAFLIFKESLNNAAKYSECTSITIVLQNNDNTLTLSISDNGKGFDQKNIKSGNGLRNMEERAKSIRAKFSIVSSIEKGTSVKVSFPIT